MNKYTAIIVTAFLIWLNILSACYFAQSWMTEKKTTIFYYNEIFSNQTEASNFVNHLRPASYYLLFGSITKDISITPYGIGYNGSYYEYDNDIHAILNGTATPTTRCWLTYIVTGTNVIQVDNYGAIEIILLAIDLIIMSLCLIAWRDSQ